MRHRFAEPAHEQLKTTAAAALAAGLAAFLVYLRTLAPGVVAILDTPGFQFVGRVLGTLHNPGYPTYVLITHVWGYLPIGSLAYRMNLFSAVCAGAAVAGVVLLLRQLDVRWWVAAAAALGMAFGSIYWSQAIIAEVYALNAATTAWMLAALVCWGRTGRPTLLFAAAGIFALALGNHTTVVLFAPGMALYALLVNREYLLRLRTLLLLFSLLVLGLAQYLFIVVRTRMGAVYLESRAMDARELLDVIRGAQFEHALFAFTFGEVLTARVLLIGRFLISELTLPIMLCASVGICVLLARRRREALLLGIGAAAQLVFVLNYDAGDIHVFTIPLLLLLWCCAGCGLDAIVSAAVRAARGAGWITIPAALALSAIPAWQVTRNFQARDLSNETEAMRQLDGLFSSLPDDSFLVRENFVLDRMLMYKILGEAAGGEREIQAHHATAAGAAAMHASGRNVFAFSETAHHFRYEGTNVSFSPHDVYARTLDQFLTELPAGMLVAVGVPGIHTERFLTVATPALNRLAVVGPLAGREQAAIAVAGVKGAPARGRSMVDARSTATATMGGLTVQADAGTASVVFAGREFARTADGAVLAVLAPDGTLQSIRVLSAASGFRIRSASGPFIPSRVLARMPILPLSSEWTDLGEGTGVWLFTLAPGSAALILSDRRSGCDLRAVDKSAASLRVGETPADVGAREEVQAMEAVRDNPGDQQALVVTNAAGAESAGVFVTAGCATRLRARGSGGASAHALQLTGMLDLPDRAVDTLLMARTTQQWLLGGGWSAVDTSEAGPFRWIDGPSAGLLLPIGRPGARLRVQVLVGPGSPVRVDGRLGDAALPGYVVEPGWHWLEWALDRPGTVHTYELELRLAGTDGELVEGRRVAVSQVEVLPAPPW